MINLELVMLDEIRCNYSAQESCFVFSWSVGIESGIHKVVIVEIPQENDTNFKSENILVVDSSPSKTKYKPRYSNDSNIHLFFVAGISDFKENDLSASDLRILCEKTEFSRFVCTGFSGIGNIFWDVSVKGEATNFSIKNSFQIPGGFLSYSYVYCGIKFSFKIYKQIEKGNQYKRLISCYLPKDAKDIKLEMPGTSVKFVKGNYKDKDKGLNIFKPLKHFFGKEKKDELF